MVRHTFAALEAWAREHDLARPVDATPLEFAASLAKVQPAWSEDARRLANDYARITWFRGPLGKESLPPLSRLWSAMCQSAAAGSGRGSTNRPA